MASLRLRLVFKNSGILSETQTSHGLQKSWILVPRPQTQLKTIAALSAYIIQSFNLQKSCPHGLLLFMDGFVLPPFESTNILKDGDIISVMKKADVMAIEENYAADEVEGMQIVKKQPVATGALLLANEEFNKESGGYESEESYDESSEDEDSSLRGDDISKKRKAPEKLQGSKKKKQRSEPLESLANEVHTEPVERSQGNEIPLGEKSTAKKRKATNHEIQTNVGTDVKSDRNVKSTPNLKRNEQVPENVQDMDGATNVSESTKKGPSRSARRKYKKRLWLREMAKIQKQNVDCESKEVQNWKQMQIKAGETGGPCQQKELQRKAGRKERCGQLKGLKSLKQMQKESGKTEGLGQPKGLLHWKEFGGKDMPGISSKGEEVIQDHNTQGNSSKHCDKVNEVIPVVIRPGHIRFEPLEEDEEEPQQRQIPAETFQWNGITTKKMGQKWGIDKGSVSRRNDYDESKEETEVDVQRHSHASEQVDFDKLAPLGGVPKKGDVIAYRLLELSSLWTPELSSFRVGKVSWYNTQSCKVLLIPVPGYPIVSKKLDEDESAGQQDDNLYNEDGSLEIEFTSLVDVRIMRNGELDPSASKETLSQAANGDCSNRGETSMVLSSSGNSTNPAAQGNGDLNEGKNGQAPSTGTRGNLWEQFSEVVNAKKKELTKENGCAKSNSNGSSFSYRALKGSTLGPTMALLRSERKYIN